MEVWIIETGLVGAPELSECNSTELIDVCFTTCGKRNQRLRRTRCDSLDGKDLSTAEECCRFFIRSQSQHRGATATCDLGDVLAIKGTRCYIAVSDKQNPSILEDGDI